MKNEPKNRLSIEVTNDVFKAIKKSGIKQSFIVSEGIKYLTGRVTANNEIKMQLIDLEKSNGKLYKINSYLSNRIIVLEKALKEQTENVTSDLKVPS